MKFKFSEAEFDSAENFLKKLNFKLKIQVANKL